jgi:hypothetical protein
MTTRTDTQVWRSTHEFNALEEPVAEAVLAEVYETLASRSEEDRLSALRLMARDEYALNEADLRMFTRLRLQAWLRLSTEDAQMVAASYEHVMQELPASAAMRRVAMVQSSLANMTSLDQERLRSLLPESMTGVRLGSFSSPPDEAPGKARKWPRWIIGRGAA